MIGASLDIEYQYVGHWTGADIDGFMKFLPIGEDDACWEWAGSKNPCGYGHYRAPRCGRAKTNIRSHRVAYELRVGPIPRGLHVLHTCDNRACCNPAHLWLGTHADNMRDKGEKGRAFRGAAKAIDAARNASGDTQ